MNQESIVFENVSKNFKGYKALDNISFSIKKGEFFSLLGPSGCGKTTLLRILAGFEQPESGRILLDGQDITKLPPHKRPINTVFQNYALFPHLTIWENIAFGLQIANRPKNEIKDEVERMLLLIQMEDHANKLPETISGGQKQRVAIARALINKPQILLLDEPLAALDLKLRQKMLLDLDKIHDEVGITFIFVTHDQTEAMAVSDRIAVLRKGTIEQIGTPVQIYEAPTSTFVADFIGDTNFFDGIVIEIEQKDYCLIDIQNQEAPPKDSELQDRLNLPPSTAVSRIMCFNDKKLAKGDAVHLSVRPEKIHISRDPPPANPLYNVFPGIVDDIIYKGDHTHFGLQVLGRKISVIQQHRRFHLDELPLRWNDHVWIWWHADYGFMLERSQELQVDDE